MNLMNLIVATMYRLVKSGASGDYFFLRFLRLLWLILVAHSGIEPGATPCRGGRCAARYPHGPQQPANKNTLIMIDVPADGVEPPQGHAGRGMG